MERDRITRYLRIAATALCLTACVLLIALWVRSYWYRDLAHAQHPNWGSTSAVSRQGKVKWSFDTYRRRVPRWKARYEISCSTIEQANSDQEGINLSIPEGDSARSFTIVKLRDGLGIVLPHWALVVCFVFLGVVPWIHWSNRFSLRTLLIATTLVAVGLAVVVYSAR